MKTRLLIFFLLTVSITIPVTSFAEQPNKTKENFQTGIIQWSSRCYSPSEIAHVTVIDRDMNLDPNTPDEFEITVWSDFDERETYVGKILPVTVIETGNATGIFEGIVFLGSAWDDASGHRVPVGSKNTIFAKYVDHTPSDHSKSIEIIETTIGQISSFAKYGENWGSSSENYGAKYVYDACLKKQIDAIGVDDPRFDWIDIVYPPPLKQLKSGLMPDEIKCKEDLEMIFRYLDRSPACVNRETIPKLFERGWMTGVIEDKWTASYVSPDQAFKHIQNFIFNSDIILDFPKASMIKRISPIPVRITGDTASQICAELKMECPTGHSFDAAYDLNSQIAAFEQSVGLHMYDVKISNGRICHMVDGDTQSYCTKLDVPYNPIFDGNKATLLSKTVEQWKDMSDEELYYFYEVYGDEFYTELGKIILKNEIKNMLNLENIVNADDDFTVYVTGIDLSLPPDVYMQTIVNGTDGKRYQFDGGTNTNQILNLSFENSPSCLVF